MGRQSGRRAGDLTEPGALAPVFKGAEGVFLVNALTLSEMQEGLAALECARRAGARRLVYLSVHGADGGPHIPHFASKLAIENAIRRTSLDYTILRPNSFFQNDVAMKQAIEEHGVYPNPLGDIGVSRVDVRDIAEAAAQAFDGRASKETVSVSGAEALTGASSAAVYAQILGRPVKYVGGDLDAWEAQMKPFLPGWAIFDLRLMFEHFREHGLLATSQEVRRLEQLLGHPPRRFEPFARELFAKGG